MHCMACKTKIVPPAKVDVYRIPYGKTVVKFCSSCLAEVKKVKRFICEKPDGLPKVSR